MSVVEAVTILGVGSGAAVALLCLVDGDGVGDATARVLAPVLNFFIVGVDAGVGVEAGTEATSLDFVTLGSGGEVAGIGVIVLATGFVAVV
jgi:hypothetical protein